MKKIISNQIEELRRENIELHRELREHEKWQKINAWTRIIGLSILVLIFSITLIGMVF